jgi:hypothetical protein
MQDTSNIGGDTQKISSSYRTLHGLFSSMLAISMWNSQRVSRCSNISSNISSNLSIRPIGKSTKHRRRCPVLQNPAPQRESPLTKFAITNEDDICPAIGAATRLASFHISEKDPGVKRLPIHLPGRHYGQMARKNGSESDAILLVRYMARPRHPDLDQMTYIEFGAKCRLEKHDPDKEMHPLKVLEDEYPGRPRMRIRFYQPGHIGVSRIQMVYPRHGDVFYLRALYSTEAPGTGSICELSTMLCTGLTKKPHALWDYLTIATKASWPLKNC